MAKKTDEPAVALAERCIICHAVFIKKHPKDNRCICEKCCDKIAKIIEAGNYTSNEQKPLCEAVASPQRHMRGGLHEQRD